MEGENGKHLQSMNKGIVDGYAGGVPFLIGDTLTTTGTSTTVESMPFRARILDVIVRTQVTHAGGTIRLYKVDKEQTTPGANLATRTHIVSDAIASAVGDACTHAGTIDATYQILEKGDGLQVRSALLANAIVGVVMVRWDG